MEELDWNQRFRLQDAFTNPQSPFKIDRTPTVAIRNRYANVQPWDSSRIKLKSPIAGSDYVNASPISLKSLGTPTSSRKASNIFVSSHGSSGSTEPSPEKNENTEVTLSETKYIATQGPKDGHFSHFWHMVMQETVGDVGVIVMLTTCYEGNKEKCSQYFPATMKNATIHLMVNEAGEDDKQPTQGDPFCDISSHDADTDSNNTDNSSPIPEGGPVQTGTKASSDKVTLLSVKQDATIGCEVRQMRLEISGQSKTIYHYLFSNWPDYGKPETEDRIALLNLVKHSAIRTGRPDNPRFVHCSAGVGRTGTFIALDHLLQELENGNLVAKANTEAVVQNTRTSTWGRSGPARESTPEGKEDVIFETVDKLREQRMMMVMNELQLCFLYEVLKEAFVEKYARKPGQNITGELPLPKVPRTDNLNVSVESKGSAAEDGEEGNSEAETEVMDSDHGMGGDGDGLENDPYGAVAPESIRREQQKTL
jgi:protein-tyrosine phosphatase